MNRIVASFLAAAAVCLVSGAAREEKRKQNGANQHIATLVVEVKDKSSREAVPGAEIFLSVHGTEFEGFTPSDDGGKAEFRRVPVGRATVQGTKSGFKTAGIEINLDRNTGTITLEMERREQSVLSVCARIEFPRDALAVCGVRAGTETRRDPFGRRKSV